MPSRSQCHWEESRYEGKNFKKNPCRNIACWVMLSYKFSVSQWIGLPAIHYILLHQLTIRAMSYRHVHKQVKSWKFPNPNSSQMTQCYEKLSVKAKWYNCKRCIWHYIFTLNTELKENIEKSCKKAIAQQRRVFLSHYLWLCSYWFYL